MRVQEDFEFLKRASENHLWEEGAMIVCVLAWLFLRNGERR
jgi:hypothetical protein